MAQGLGSTSAPFHPIGGAERVPAYLAIYFSSRAGSLPDTQGAPGKGNLGICVPPGASVAVLCLNPYNLSCSPVLQSAVIRERGLDYVSSGIPLIQSLLLGLMLPLVGQSTDAIVGVTVPL